MPVLPVPLSGLFATFAPSLMPTPPNWLVTRWLVQDSTMPTQSCMACRNPSLLNSSANKTCWLACRLANESFEQCRTTAQRTSLATSGIEDPVLNSYSHSQKFLAQAHHLICSSLLNHYQPTRQLRSSSSNLLVQPPSKTKFGSLAFHTAAPSIWNGLPAHVRLSPSFQTFKKMLKTHYFLSPPT